MKKLTEERYVKKPTSSFTVKEWTKNTLQGGCLTAHTFIKYHARSNVSDS